MYTVVFLEAINLNPALCRPMGHLWLHRWLDASGGQFETYKMLIYLFS